MSSIRYLKPEEVGLCIEGGKDFFDEGKLPGGFVPEIFVRSWKSLIESQRGAVIGSFDGETITGALGAVLAPDPNNGHTMAIELFWFVIERYRGHGLRLLKEFERWAKFRNAKRAAMIHLLNLQPERLSCLYERLGYRAVETNYLKEL